MFNSSVNFKDTKKIDRILESSSDVQSFLNAIYVIYQLSEVKDDIQVRLLIPMFIGTLCRVEN